MECIFCKIVNNEVQSIRIYEDSDVLAILDIFPANPGHILILPKKHIKYYWELDDGLIGKMFVLAKYISSALINGLKAEGVNLYLASGEAAGQRSDHLILHLIPRFRNDDINFEWNRKKIDFNELIKIGEIIKSFLKISTQTEVKKEVKEKKEDKKYVNSNVLIWFKKMP